VLVFPKSRRLLLLLLLLYEKDGGSSLARLTQSLCSSFNLSVSSVLKEVVVVVVTIDLILLLLPSFRPDIMGKKSSIAQFSNVIPSTIHLDQILLGGVDPDPLPSADDDDTPVSGNVANNVIAAC
jgi:hypothetical protein